MNEGNKLAVTICVGLISVVFTLSGFIFSYYVHQDKIVAQMVKDGENPLEAMCSMTDTFGNHPLCMVLATNKSVALNTFNK